MNGYEVLVVVLALLWTFLSILNQFEQLNLPIHRVIQKLDIFQLLPLWTFFAPNPGQSDYHLVYRDRYQDNSITDWVELSLSEPRNWYSFFWNPQKRSKKVLSDIASTLVSSIPRNNESLEGLMFTTPYLLLLNVVSHQPPVNLHAAENKFERQFLLLETFGFKPSSEQRYVLRSNYHPITPLQKKKISS
jgi:hypothetical protein